MWQFGQDLRGAGQGTVVYNLTNWDASAGLGHVSHENAQSGVPVAQQMACTSSAERQNLPRVNEIVCFRLDGSMDVLVVAPNMTDLNASGGGSDDYSKRPKGNLDPTGEYFVWTTNLGTNRNDAFIVRIPQQKLGVAGGAPAPSPIAGANSGSSAVANSNTGHTCPGSVTRAGAITRSGSRASTGARTLTVAGRQRALDEPDQRVSERRQARKTGGCDGCPDASAVSEQQISGTGTLSVRGVRSRRHCGSSVWARVGLEQGPATSTSRCVCRAVSPRCVSPEPTTPT